MTDILPVEHDVRVADIIKRALRLLKVYNPGQSIPGDELADNLTVFNSMLDYFSSQRFSLYSLITESFPLTDGLAAYAIGEDETFDTDRPENINVDASYITDANGYDYPLISMTKEEYNAIGIKNITGIPTRLYYDPAFPVGTIYLYPASSANLTLYLVCKKAFSQIGDVEDQFDFPAGYRAMFEYNLAVWLAPEYVDAVPNAVGVLALQTLNAVQTNNIKPNRMALDINSKGSGSIFDS